MAKITALYPRVSTDKQVDEGYSLSAQTKMLENYCRANSITNFEVYEEAGFSGFSTARPEFDRLMQDIHSGKIERIVVYKLDRLSRNLRDTLALIEDIIIPNNISLVSLNENLDTSTPHGRAMIAILATFAQMERDTIRMRFKFGAEERAKEGLWHGGGNVTFGYDYCIEKGTLVPNENAEKVKQAYQLYIQGHSTTEIATMLGFKYPDRVAKILKRPTYTGYILRNGELYKGQHEPLVSEEIFAQAQEQLKSRTWNRVGKHYYLLQNISVCGFCGAKIYYFPNSRGKTYMRCYSRQSQQKYMKHADNCPFHAKRIAEIEKNLVRELFALQYKTDVSGSESLGKEDILKKQKAQMTQKLSRLYNLYAESENEILKGNIDSLLKEIEKIDLAISMSTEVAQKAKLTHKTQTIIDSIESAWDYMTAQEKQQTVRALVEKVIIDNDNVTIHFTQNVDSEPVSFAVPPLLRANSKLSREVLKGENNIEVLMENHNQLRTIINVFSPNTPWLTAKEIAQRVGLKRVQEDYINPALRLGLISMKRQGRHVLYSKAA